MDKDEKALIQVPIDKQIMEEEDPSELQELIDLFNLHLKKKDIVRSAKLSEVQDKIVDQMSKRIESRPDEFSNSDLLNYHKVVQETLTKSDNTLDSINVPSIQINQQINMNSADNDTFDRESRQRILDTVNVILDNLVSIETEVDEDE